MQKNTLSETFSCGHCANTAPMKVIGEVNNTKNEMDDEFSPIYSFGTTYSILECFSCKKVNVVSYFWHEAYEDEDGIKYELIHPKNKNLPIGLPDHILQEFKAADEVKRISVNAYVILVRRLLEMVCIDRKAKGGSLNLMLEDLANKNEIPIKLVKVAKGLKDFGNIGAHAGKGELSESEIPIVNALCTAILEYIYSAPYLAEVAEKQLNSIKTKNETR